MPHNENVRDKNLRTRMYKYSMSKNNAHPMMEQKKVALRFQSESVGGKVKKYNRSLSQSEISISIKW